MSKKVRKTKTVRQSDIMKTFRVVRFYEKIGETEVSFKKIDYLSIREQLRNVEIPVAQMDENGNLSRIGKLSQLAMRGVEVVGTISLNTEVSEKYRLQTVFDQHKGKYLKIKHILLTETGEEDAGGTV